MKILKLLGWIFVPFIMIFVSWKNMKSVGRSFGTIWAVIAFLAFLGNAISNDPVQPDSTVVAQSDVSSKAEVENTDKETAKALKAAEKEAAKKEKEEAKKEKEAKAAAAKLAAEEEKKKKEEEERLAKEAEEAEYNKPENVYERWVQAQFSAWDGSHTALKNAVKENMNDPKSFKHVETTYSHKGNMEGIDVYMKFRGTNAFGGVVTNVMHGSVDYATNTISYKMVE